MFNWIMQPLFDRGQGILQPALTELIVKGVYFDEVSTLLKVMCFDTALVAATEYDTINQTSMTSGLTTSAFGRVRDYDIDTATLHNSAVDIYCVANAVVASGARGDVTVLGKIVGITKVGSAAHVAGQGFLPSMGTIGTLAPHTTLPTTLVAGARTRKVIARALNAVTAATATVHFNGFGWGVDLTNVAVGAD